MRIIKEKEGKILDIKTKELSLKSLSQISEVGMKILEVLKEGIMYPKQIAKKLKIHEQNVYYYIRKLEIAGMIKVAKQERIQGTIAKFYALTSDSFYVKIGDFKESSKVNERELGILKNFIENGELNALIVVGSPDPHGPMKARSKDGYFGMDLALFLGTFLTNISESKVKLDTEVLDKDLKENNLIILGGPIVNKVAESLGSKVPIYYNEKKKGFYSTLSGKTYVHEEVGVINICKSPFNPDKEIIFIAGIRNSGTKASIMAFLKKLDELEEGNSNDSDIKSRVVEGLDLDSDGIVDDVEILE
ncbi:hypothetical protein COU54_02010 [Candidatus Pacearchaeota archaeon CG10_big_fil_rev_8_21_14_0_10_31_24]|nr:MAG: hypothetical protein COU54_02010 [Candidatus Pacearchaeota archaeon CG10_big_fil_rev_8_21_14_0_10_31_24]